MWNFDGGRRIHLIKPQGEYANFLEQHYVILPTLSTLFNLHKGGIYTCLLCDDNLNFVY